MEPDNSIAVRALRARIARLGCPGRYSVVLAGTITALVAEKYDGSVNHKLHFELLNALAARPARHTLVLSEFGQRALRAPRSRPCQSGEAVVEAIAIARLVAILRLTRRGTSQTTRLHPAFINQRITTCLSVDAYLVLGRFPQ
jgi:hypothetical protein